MLSVGGNKKDGGIMLMPGRLITKTKRIARDIQEPVIRIKASFHQDSETNINSYATVIQLKLHEAKIDKTKRGLEDLY